MNTHHTSWLPPLETDHHRIIIACCHCGRNGFLVIFGDFSRISLFVLLLFFLFNQPWILDFWHCTLKTFGYFGHTRLCTVDSAFWTTRLWAYTRTHALIIDTTQINTHTILSESVIHLYTLHANYDVQSFIIKSIFCGSMSTVECLIWVSVFVFTSFDQSNSNQLSQQKFKNSNVVVGIWW